MTTESAASSRRGAPIGLIIGLFATLVLLLHARSFLPLVFEDALISLRYARRLVEGLGLTFTEGEVVEGYSNLLWVLLCALLHWFGMDLIDASRLLGTLGGVAAIAGIVYAFRPANWSGALPAFAGAMALALTVPIAIWAIAGLETTFLAGLLVWALVFLRPLLDRESIG